LRAPQPARYRGRVAERIARKRRPSNPEPQTAASLLPQVVARLGGDDRALEQRVSLAWKDAVGESLARRARPEAVRGKTLYVRVESSSLAHELTLLKRRVLEKLSLALGGPLIEDMRTRTGPLSNPTPSAR
jgi:predicted nucleic acid-binding Zn ribbon protein